MLELRKIDTKQASVGIHPREENGKELIGWEINLGQRIKENEGNHDQCGNHGGDSHSSLGGTHSLELR